MTDNAVIVVECREPGIDSAVIAFVASSWPLVDSFVSDPKNRGYSRHDYFWWAQENFVDNDDPVYNTGRTRTYDKDGLLLADDTPTPAQQTFLKDVLTR